MANLMEAALDWKLAEDPHFLDRLGFEDRQDLIWQVVLQFAPDTLMPALEVGVNYDTFRDRSIVSPYDLGIDPALQYNRWTSETAKWLGGLLQQSPAKIDPLVYGYASGIGKMVTRQSDEGLAALGVVPSRPSAGPYDWPAISALYTGASLGSSTASVNQFYRELERLEGAAGSVRRYWQAGQSDKAYATADAEGLTVTVEKGRVVVGGARLKALRAARTDLTDLRGDLTRIYQDWDLTPQAKRTQLDQVTELMVNRVRAALGRAPLTRTTRREPK